MERFEIIKGHDGGACFWIQPVKVHARKCFDYDAVEECPEEEISLDEEDVYSFLDYFFRKYFDEYLLYNRERKEDCSGNPGWPMAPVFEWYLTHNFYTHEKAEKMAADMENYANDLENNGLDAVLEEMKERYLIAFNPRVVKQDLHWNAKACRANIEQKLPDLIGYYRGVAFHIREMMKNNPDRPLISIMGP